MVPPTGKCPSTWMKPSYIHCNKFECSELARSVEQIGVHNQMACSWMKPSCIAKLQDEKKLNFWSFMLKVLIGKKITRSSTPISIRPHFVFSEESSIPSHINLWQSPMPSSSQGFSLSLLLATNTIPITIPGFQNLKWLGGVNLKYVVHGWELALYNLLNSCSLHLHLCVWT